MKLVLEIGAFCALAVFLSLGIPFTLNLSQNHKTVITDKEVSVSRVNGVWGHEEYSVNLETGDEKMVIYNLFEDTIFVDYEGSCQCVNQVFKVNNYFVSLSFDGNVYYSTGKTVKEVVPYSQVRDKFEEGMSARNQLAEKYKDIISQAKNDS